MFGSTKTENQRRCLLHRRSCRAAFTGVLLTACLVGPSVAGDADVVTVRAEKTSAGQYRFDVSVRHGDTGWKHYADRWDVVGPKGKVFGTRVLYHPHVDEQPFTRSLTGVRIPAGVERVTLRARDKVHGYGGREITVKLPE